MSTKAVVILVAAGRGERMGAIRPKAFLSLGGEPLLLKSARPFEAAASVVSLVAVVPAADVAAARSLLAPLQKLVAVVAGGERRQDSVLEGLKQVPSGFDGVVLVHDAARPFVDEALIEAVIGAAARTERPFRSCPSWTPSSGSAKDTWSRPSTARSSAPPRRRRGFAWTSSSAPMNRPSATV